MTDYGPAPGSGVRDNGLRCGGYVAVGDLDPRVADALLETLRAEGIAAYASPTPATRGGYLELRLPEQLTDRVFADSTKSERAKTLYEQEKADSLPEPAPAQPPASSSPAEGEPARELDVDAAWNQLLTSLQTPTETATWPTREDVGANSAPALFDADALSLSVSAASEGIEIDEEHYEPPQAPPLPRLRRVTVVSLIAIIGGLVILVTGVDGGDLSWLGIAAILGGGAALVWHVKDGPPTDSGWDDGAVV